MKVKFIVSKYKPVEGEEWYKAGDIADLPDAEARAAIAANVAIEQGSTPVYTQPSIDESSPRGGGRPAKKE